jgi:hypothetical protein
MKNRPGQRGFWVTKDVLDAEKDRMSVFVLSSAGECLLRGIEWA